MDGCSLNHLRFANDIVLISDNLTELEEILNHLNTAPNKIGLKIYLNKKIMSSKKKG